MSHLIDTVEKDGLRARAMERPPFGPGFKVVPRGADRMEVWGSSFKDPGPDYCEFRLMKGTKVLEVRRVEGY